MCYKDDYGGELNILGKNRAGHCEERSSCEHVSNCECLPTESCLDLPKQKHFE